LRRRVIPFDILSIYLLIIRVMRRRAGALVPLEVAICVRAAAIASRGPSEFHGYELARQLADLADHRSLTGYGTLYRALSRLKAMGLLQSRAEDPAIAERERRPPRRLYKLTALGAEAAGAETTPVVAPRRSSRRRIAPA